MSWHKIDDALYQKFLLDLKQGFPNLQASEREGRIVVKGVFEVWAGGTYIDKFDIEIDLPDDYPQTLPMVREIGGRIPPLPERHINPSDQSACLFVPDERWKHWPPGSSFNAFLAGPVHYFFLGQAFYARTEKWPFGERRHGMLGIFDSYCEELGIRDASAIAQCLDVISRGTIRGHWDCPCGSGAKIRKCHGKVLRKLQENIPNELISKARTIALAIAQGRVPS